MKLYLTGHDYKYAAEQIMLTMFPGERPEYPEGVPNGERAELVLFDGQSIATAKCRLYTGCGFFIGEARVSRGKFEDAIIRERLLQRIIKLAFYRAAKKALGTRPLWGALTGIRPGKIMTAYLEDGLSPRRAVNKMIEEYDVSREKANLCLDTAFAGLDEKKKLGDDEVCLYIGIPFCPTRCAYCSFVSLSVEKSLKLIPDYLRALTVDIQKTGDTLAHLGIRPAAIYLGGGTPTTLSAAEMRELLTCIKVAFDLSAVREYTVEAGRPDTITREKLEVLHDFGVNRLSINPQSMDDSVLEAIGRRHSTADIIESYELARKVGDFAINMDLIAGLPSDIYGGFVRSLDTVVGMKPENITVHTLSMKKGSKIMLEGVPVPQGDEVRDMVDYSMQTLAAAEYSPYYLYRQKYISGGLENVGWSKDGFCGLYNICIMEEYLSIISMGGGASTKLVTGDGRIERLFAPKYPEQYIGAMGRILNDKKKIEKFWLENISRNRKV